MYPTASHAYQSDTKSATAHVYQIRSKRSEKEIFTPKLKFARSNALMRTSRKCVLMVTALQGTILYIQYDTS